MTFVRVRGKVLVVMKSVNLVKFAFAFFSTKMSLKIIVQKSQVYEFSFSSCVFSTKKRKVQDENHTAPP